MAADPDVAAREHSARLADVIGEEIRVSGGAIPFSRFMELALYAPGLGYYSAGATKFGAAGDFVTAPELGPLFAACVADAVAPVLQQLGPEAGFLEVGGGSGAFAEVALKKLMAVDALPSRYAILEPSADLRARQREHLRERLVPPLFDLLDWPDTPFQQAWDGVVFANEVVDALPTPRFSLRDGEVFEEHVTLDGNGMFVRDDRPADALLAAAVRHVERQLDAPFADGYRSELLPQLPYWVQAVVGPLRRGALLFIDYGHPRREYYRPARTDGTLRAFRRRCPLPPARCLLRRGLPGRRPGLAPVSSGGVLKPLRRPWLWLGLWIGAIVGVVILSLVPPPDMDLPAGADKVEHFIAYFAISASAVQLFESRRALLWIGLGMVALGVGLEFAQHLATTTRQMDQGDAWADLLGVIAGLATTLTPMRDLLLRLEGGRR